MKETHSCENDNGNQILLDFSEREIIEMMEIADIQLIFDNHEIFPLLEDRG